MVYICISILICIIFSTYGFFFPFFFATHGGAKVCINMKVNEVIWLIIYAMHVWKTWFKKHGLILKDRIDYNLILITNHNYMSSLAPTSLQSICRDNTTV